MKLKNDQGDSWWGVRGASGSPDFFTSQCDGEPERWNEQQRTLSSTMTASSKRLTALGSHWTATLPSPRLQLFERLQEEQPGFAEKIIAVNSDLTQPELNLSKEDQSVLAENIDVVFHCAATIRFNEPLKWVQRCTVPVFPSQFSVAQAYLGFSALRASVCYVRIPSQPPPSAGRATFFLFL